MHQHQLIPFGTWIRVLKDIVQVPTTALRMVFDNQEQKGETVLI